MRVESAEWNPPGHRGSYPSASTLEVRNLKAGDIKRIVHDDIVCNITCSNSDGRKHNTCCLAQEIGRLRHKHGWCLEYYHEDRCVLVIKRTK